MEAKSLLQQVIPRALPRPTQSKLALQVSYELGASATAKRQMSCASGTISQSALSAVEEYYKTGWISDLLVLGIDLPRIFKTRVEFVLAQTHVSESKLGLELHARPVIELQNFLPEQEDYIGCRQTDNQIEMNPPILLKKPVMRLEIEILDVPRISAVTRVLVRNKATEPLRVAPNVDRYGPQTRQYHRVGLEPSGARLKVAAI